MATEFELDPLGNGRLIGRSTRRKLIQAGMAFGIAAPGLSFRRAAAFPANQPITGADFFNFKWVAGGYWRDPNDDTPDVVGIKVSDVKNPQGMIEAHVIAGSHQVDAPPNSTSGRGFTTWDTFVDQRATPISQDDAPYFQWVAGDFLGRGVDDLIGIKVSDVKNENHLIEAHVLDSYTHYEKFLEQFTTMIPASDPPNYRWAAGDYNRDKRVDLVAISGTEVYILDGSDHFQTALFHGSFPAPPVQNCVGYFAWDWSQDVQTGESTQCEDIPVSMGPPIHTCSLQPVVAHIEDHESGLLDVTSGGINLRSIPAFS